MAKSTPASNCLVKKAVSFFTKQSDAGVDFACVLSALFFMNMMQFGLNV